MFPYVDYCSKQCEACDFVIQLRKERPQFSAFIDQDLPAWRGLKLEDYLVKPFQRISRYPLLIREVIKVTPKSNSSYDELVAAHELFEQLLNQANKTVKKTQRARMNKQVWSMIESSQNCNSFIKTNLQFVESLLEKPDIVISSYKAPKVIDHFVISYRKDGSVPHPGHCIIFENCIFLLYGKHGQLTLSPLDLIPLLSLELKDENDKNLITDKSTFRSQIEKAANVEANMQLYAQDDKEISYLVAKFVRFERLFGDEIRKVKQSFEPLLSIDLIRENIFPLVASIAALLSAFIEGLDKVEQLLLNPKSSDDINWLDIYLTFMELMPRFEDVGIKVIECLPQCYIQAAFTPSFTEKNFIETIKHVFEIVNHTPAYVRSASRILQRIKEDDPNLPSLLGTFRMIETSVKGMDKLRKTFESNLAVLQISSKILSENIFKPQRHIIFQSRVKDLTTQGIVKCYLFNDLLITCRESPDKLLELKNSISLVSTPKHTITSLTMSPTSFQLLVQESGKHLITLSTRTETETLTWMGHIKSVLENNLSGSSASSVAASKNSQIKITGSSNVIWSLCFSSPQDAKNCLLKILPIYHNYLAKSCSSYAQDLYHQLDAETRKQVPNFNELMYQYTPGTPEFQVIQELQAIAVIEHKRHESVLNKLEFHKASKARYIEFLGNLQQASLMKYGTSEQGMQRKKTSSGTSTFNTIRKLLS